MRQSPAPTAPIAKPIASAAAAAQAIHRVPEHERGGGDAELIDRSRNTSPFSATAEVGANDRGDRGRGEKPGRAQCLRCEECPRDLSRDVHNLWKYSHWAVQTAVYVFNAQAHKRKSGRRASMRSDRHPNGSGQAAKAKEADVFASAPSCPQCISLRLRVPAG